MLKEATSELTKRLELVDRRLAAIKEEVPLLEEERECLARLINLYQTHPYDAITAERRSTFRMKLVEDIEGLKDDPVKPPKAPSKVASTNRKKAVEDFEVMVQAVLVDHPARSSELLRAAGYPDTSTSSMRLGRMVDKGLIARQNKQYVLVTKGVETNG